MNFFRSSAKLLLDWNPRLSWVLFCDAEAMDLILAAQKVD